MNIYIYIYIYKLAVSRALQLRKLEEIEWKEFIINELFSVKIGKSIDGNKVNMKTGRIAYITRKERDNGLDGFIDFDKRFLNTDFPVITIGNETAKPFVQRFKFFTGTKVNILQPKNILAYENALDFIKTSLEQHKTKYSYSYTINSTRLKKQKIFLPLDENRLLNYRYMKEYIQI